MDPQVLVAAQTASATMIALLATDVWERTRDGVVGVWRRFRPEQAESVSASLDDAHTSLLAARERGDEDCELDLTVQWSAPLARLLAHAADAARELDAVLADARSRLSEAQAATVPTINMSATASGNARVYQAGRDQHITER